MGSYTSESYIRLVYCQFLPHVHTQAPENETTANLDQGYRFVDIVLARPFPFKVPNHLISKWVAIHASSLSEKIR